MDSKRFLRGLVIGLAAILAQAAPAEDVGPRVMECLDVGPVWSGHAVGFCLLTFPQGQYVACYAPDRRMTVARRAPGSRVWEFKTLGSTVGWDSHNYVTMAVDEIGHLHVSGNMHVHPLVYFRTERPGDIGTLRAVPAMVGDLERRCTYPRFFAGPQGELIFTYRDGASGSGNQIYNTYDARAQTWRRLLEEPLLDGRGAMNAYPVGPDGGPTAASTCAGSGVTRRTATQTTMSRTRGAATSCIGRPSLANLPDQRLGLPLVLRGGRHDPLRGPRFAGEGGR